ncbi:MAG TPA: hypothetical protein VFR09_02330 [Alphaproteobacteria bacterium]|nr:hypothetical protein [Alphaproteobacteria bacterium]
MPAFMFCSRQRIDALLIKMIEIRSDLSAGADFMKPIFYSLILLAAFIALPAEAGVLLPQDNNVNPYGVAPAKKSDAATDANKANASLAPDTTYVQKSAEPQALPMSTPAPAIVTGGQSAPTEIQPMFLSNAAQAQMVALEQENAGGMRASLQQLQQLLAQTQNKDQRASLEQSIIAIKQQLAQSQQHVGAMQGGALRMTDFNNLYTQTTP